MKIKSLMLGWEFPPYISGGLGTACYGLTKAMGRLGMEVTFLLPRMGPVRVGGSPETFWNQDSPTSGCVRSRPACSRMAGMAIPRSARSATAEAGVQEEPADGPAPYGPNICEEVHRYALRVMKIAESRGV